MDMHTIQYNKYQYKI